MHPDAKPTTRRLIVKAAEPIMELESGWRWQVCRRNPSDNDGEKKEKGIRDGEREREIAKMDSQGGKWGLLLA